MYICLPSACWLLGTTNTQSKQYKIWCKQHKHLQNKAGTYTDMAIIKKSKKLA
jgi:hypothetical protein